MKPLRITFKGNQMKWNEYKQQEEGFGILLGKNVPVESTVILCPGFQIIEWSDLRK